MTIDSTTPDVDSEPAGPVIPERAATSCCSPTQQASCCDASDKATCCGTAATTRGSCGCQ